MMQSARIITFEDRRVALAFADEALEAGLV
jgi:hypothetical protein